MIKQEYETVTSEIKTFDGNTYTANDEILAKRSADLLNQHYPGHLWAINVNSTKTGGVMVIKNFAISYKYGMVLHLDNLDDKKIIMAAGEFLERAKMKRGKWNQENAKHIDGIPDIHQPFQGIIV